MGTASSARGSMARAAPLKLLLCTAAAAAAFSNGVERHVRIVNARATRASTPCNTHLSRCAPSTAGSRSKNTATGLTSLGHRPLLLRAATPSRTVICPKHSS
eukprot:6203828-Pleurochrysis_carterae.AAC.3